MNKQELWPREGKLKKGLIMLVIVIFGALGIVLLQEKSDVRVSKKLPVVIALICVAVWFYQPVIKEKL